MRKKSSLLICLGVLFLATSCSSAVKPYDVSEETLQKSIDLLSERSSDATDYIYRYNELLNKYTSYVDPIHETSLLPDSDENTTNIHPSIDIAGKKKEEVAILVGSG